MKIAVWNTGHEIADTVAQSIYAALKSSYLLHTKDLTPELIKSYDIHIGYGILRGMGDVFREASRQKRKWFNVDRGYFGPGHYNGNYRISLEGTQHSFRCLPRIMQINERNFDQDVMAWKGLDTSKSVLVCPPTDYAVKFFGINEQEWYYEVKRQAYFLGFGKCIIRPKGTKKPLQEHLDKCGAVITFNSAVGWEALRQGIPVISDPTVSFIGTNCREISLDKLSHFQQNNRRSYFEAMSKLQMSLDEMKAELWPLMAQLISLSDMTRENRRAHTLQQTASEGVHATL